MDLFFQVLSGILVAAILGLERWVFSLQKDLSEFKLKSAEHYVTKIYIEPQIQGIMKALGDIEKLLARMEGRAEGKAEGHG